MLGAHNIEALDCSSPETTERSLSILLNISRATLHDRCRAFDLHGFYEHDWGPASEVGRRVLGGKLPEGQYRTHFFHATRVIPARRLFADGLLPLGAAV